MLIYGDSFNRWMTGSQKTIPTLAKPHRKTEEVSGASLRSRRNSRNVWKSCKHGSRLTRNWKQPTPNRPKPKMAILVAEQIAENAKAVNQRIPVVQAHTTGSTTDQAAQQTSLSLFKSFLSMRSMGCNSVSEQLMAAGATDEDVKNISHIMAQTVRQLEAGSAPPEPARLTVSRAKWWFPTKSSPRVNAHLDSAKWTSRAKQPSREAYVHRKERGLAKKCTQEGEGLSPTPTLVLDPIHRRAFRSGDFQNW